MKIISNIRYKKLIESYSEPHSAITYKEQCEILKQQLKEAKDLKFILEKIVSINGIDWGICGGSITQFDLPNNVLQYTDDILGGKVIKQDGTKCLVIEKDGEVKIGLTKQKPDKGFSYKLVRN